MGANSIRTNLNKESIISEIRLFRSADSQHQFTHIVVEGTDDIRFLQYNVSKQVNLYESFSGKLGVLEIVNSFNSADVIGICDRDYDSNDPPAHIFYYDYSCLETMMLSSFDSFEKMCTTLYLHITNAQQIYHNMFFQIRWLGALRKINYQNRLGISFLCIAMPEVFDKSKKVLNLPKMISCIRLANRDIFSSNPQIIRLAGMEVKKILNTEDNLWISNGHDALQMLQCLCETAQSPRYNENVIRTSLILSYDFRSSTLFSLLMHYQTENNLKIVILPT